jgi:hypothetical protein
MVKSLNRYQSGIVFETTAVTYSKLEKQNINDFITENDYLRLAMSPTYGKLEMDSRKNHFNIITLTDLDIDFESESNEELVIDDHVFLLDLNQSYFHALYDNFGQWLVLKKYIPELKTIFVNTQDIKTFEGTSYKSTIMNWAGVTLENGYYEASEYKSLKFKKVSFIHSGTSHILREVVHQMPQQDEITLDLNDRNNALFYMKSKLLKNFVNENIITKNLPRNKKVYISRIQTRRMYDRIFLFKKLVMDNGVSWNGDGSFNDPNDFLLKTNLDAFKPAGIFGPMHEIDFRYLDIEDEMLIERFFSSQGYEILNGIESMSMEDQINTFAQCSHIATLAGAGSVNAIFLGDGTMVYLAPNTGYSFHHEDIIESITENSVIPLDKRIHNGPSYAMPVFKMLQMLKDEYGDQI